MALPANAALLDVLLKSFQGAASAGDSDADRFRSAAAVSLDAIWDADLLDGTIWWNEAYDRVLDAQPPEAATSWQWWTERLHPDDRLRVLDSLKDAREGSGDEWSVEYRVRRTDGSWVHVWDRARILRDGEGTATRIVGIMLDVTERRESEQRLQMQYDAARVLSESRSLNEAARSLLRSIGELLSWSWGGFWGVDRDAGVLRCVDYWHRDLPNLDAFAAVSRDLVFEPGDVLAGRVWQEQRPLWMADATQQAQFQRASRAAEAGLRGYVAFPVISGGEVLGVMEFAGQDASEPSPQLLEAFGAIGAQLGQAVQRWQAAEDLRASELRFRVLAESMPALVWIAREDGSVSYFNSRASRIKGLAPGDDGTWAWHHIVHPDDLERTVQTFMAAAQSRQVYEIEHRLLMADGTARWHLSRAEHTIMPAGDVRWYGSTIDIEDFKQAEQARADSEERFRSLFESIDEGYCLCEMLFDDDGRPADYRFLEINHHFSEYTGIQPDAVGKTARELVPGLEDWWVQTYGNVVLTGEPTRFQQGSEAMGRYFDVYVTPVGNHNRSRFAIVFNDITADRQAEEALKESEDRFRNLADNISQFAWMADASGSIFWYNQRWYDYTGTNLEEMQGWGWKSVHHPDHVDRVVARFQQSLAEGEFWEDTFPLRGKDGEYRWFLSRARPIRDAEGKIVRWFGTNTDVTEQRQTEEALRIANGHKDQFLGLVSHELRSPIATIITNAWLLQARGEALPADIREQSYADILTEGRRLQDTIENLLLLTRGETSDGFEAVDLAELIEGRMREFGERHPSRRLELTNECVESVVAGRPGLLGMVFDNLLSNANKYSPADRPIHVSIRPNAAGEIEVHVVDEGIGIPESELASMFTPFHRTEVAQKYAAGMGLGLAVCKRILDAHEGRIWIEPGPAIGSDFAFAVGRYRDHG